MAKLSIKDKVYVLISWALMFMCSTAEREYFLQSRNLTWDEARTHCQVCFKDLVTLTPENIQTIVQNLTSDHWVGLRRNFSSTTNPRMFWSRWADGAPVTFQNWQPGQPVLESSLPNMDCCSCSCTNPTNTSSPTDTATATATATDTDVTVESSTKDMTSSSGSTNPSESPTTMSMMTSQSGLLSDALDTDENHIDFCVVMLSFGAWVEQKCSDLLPFICYEDRFFGRATVTNVTSSSAVLSWLPAPGNISHYRVQVNGSERELTTNQTDLTYDLNNLTPGTHYSVQVFPVKCERELNPQNVAFYTSPSKVENITVTVVTETSISLSWNKPPGNVDFYRIDVEGRQNQTVTEGIEVSDLTSGSPYTFTILSGVKDKSRWSEESSVTAYTKPGKVSNLTVSENTNTSLLLNWVQPRGRFRGFMVKAMSKSSDVLFDQVVNETTVRLTNLPSGTRITLSVTALASDTLEGDKIEVINYTTPRPVSNLTLMTTHDSLTASWDSSERNDSSFTVLLQLDGKTVKTQEKLLTCSMHFDGLKTGANYTAVVYTVNGHLQSPPVESYKFTLPLPPENVTVGSSGLHYITIQWKPPVNTAADTYSVKISSSFWGHSWNETVVNKTSHRFDDLKSGTKYEFEVSTVVDGKSSPKVNGSHFTDADKREVSLSMICSSTERLCDKITTEEIVFRELHAHFNRLLGDNVFWKLEMKETEKN